MEHIRFLEMEDRYGAAKKAQLPKILDYTAIRLENDTNAKRCESGCPYQEAILQFLAKAAEGDKY